MNVDSILLSEYASVDRGGRLTVVNSFNRLNGPGPQWGIPIIYLSLVVSAHEREAKTRHQCEVTLVDAQRNSVLSQDLEFEMEFTNKTPDAPGMPLRHVTAVSLMGIVFQAPGPYAFEVYIDGVFHGAHTLFIKKVDKKDG